MTLSTLLFVLGQEATDAAGGAEASASGFLDFWDYQLFALDGTAITAGKIVIGLGLLALGFLIARVLSRVVRHTLMARLKVAEGAAGLIGSLLFYLLLVVVFFATMTIIAVPLGGLLDFWKYEFLKIDGEPITVRKVVIGLVLLVFGLQLARILSRIARGAFIARLKMTEGGAAAIESVLFYLLLVIVVLSSLNIVGVPLTAFTLLGGAAAIGIGFGSQNILNNFISGLILLAERPVNVGNLIQIGDLFGTVEHMGPRSTRVRTGNNVVIIVPNSTFLEQNVVNWTLNNPLVRVSVGVGVIYGSPLDAVSKLIRQAVDEHPRIKKSPEPILLFTEFGDNSLNFEIHFWIEMKTTMDERRIESDVRYKIDALFREAGLVIAFPQRDVHLDTVKPLEVRVVAQGAD